MSNELNTLFDKNITFLFGSLELGGAERQALRYSIYLRKEFNANVEVCGFNNPGESTVFCDKNNIPWRILSNPLSKIPIKNFFLIQKFIREMKETQPDLILPYTLIPNVVAGLVWRKTNAKLCVWNQRDTGIEQFKQRIEKKAINNTPLILSNSRIGAEMLVRKYELNPVNIHIIPNAIEMDPPLKTRQEWRKKLAIDEDTIVACMVANLSRWKDHVTLIKAWKILSGNTSEININRPHLVLAGRFDDTYESLKKFVFKLELSDCIHFLGKVDDISGLLQSVDLGILSSHSEGCPNGMLECMAEGLPVIGSDIPGIRDAIGNDNSYYLVPEGDPISLSNKILELINDENLRFRSGRFNKNRIQTCFNPNIIWKKQSKIIAANIEDE